MFKSVLKAGLIMYACLVLNVANASVVKMEDPLRPPEYKQVSPSKSPAVKKPGWQVNEILFSGERRVAIINNVAVVIGDHINGAHVVDIKSGHVVLKYKDKIINARLKTMSVKKQLKQK